MTQAKRLNSTVLWIKFLNKCETSLFLQLDPRAISGSGGGDGQKSLPVGMYESTMDLSSHQDTPPRLHFVKNQYKIETNEAERIAVDHVAKPDMSSTQSSLGSSCKVSSIPPSPPYSY